MEGECTAQLNAPLFANTVFLRWDDQHVLAIQRSEVIGEARLAQSVERLALNQVVVGSSPTVGASFAKFCFFDPQIILYYSPPLRN